MHRMYTIKHDVMGQKNAGYGEVPREKVSRKGRFKLLFIKESK